MLRAATDNFLEGGEERMSQNLSELTRMVCHGEHTYLYSQSVLHTLAQVGAASLVQILQGAEEAASCNEQKECYEGPYFLFIIDIPVLIDCILADSP